MSGGHNENDTRGPVRRERSQRVLEQLRGAQTAPAGLIRDRRGQPDRRRLTLFSLIYGGFHPRRRHVRREDENTMPVVDWHDSRLLAVSVGILLLSCADAFLTLNLLVLGAHEANPLMARLIAMDVGLFMAVKMILTSTGILVMVALSRYRLFGRFRVVGTLYAMLAVYCLLVLYQLVLIAHAA
jgi:hypothetical protein